MTLRYVIRDLVPYLPSLLSVAAKDFAARFDAAEEKERVHLPRPTITVCLEGREEDGYGEFVRFRWVLGCHSYTVQVTTQDVHHVLWSACSTPPRVCLDSTLDIDPYSLRQHVRYLSEVYVLDFHR